METRKMMITPDTISDAIADAPAWALIALTVSKESLRHDARREVAEHVYKALYRPLNVDTGQLPLPL